MVQSIKNVAPDLTVQEVYRHLVRNEDVKKKEGEKDNDSGRDSNP